MSRKDFYISEALEIKNVLLRFLRHPMTEIKNLPQWNWGRILALHIAVTAVVSVLAGIIERKLNLSVIFGVFFSPLLTLITLGIMTLFFYYCFQIFANLTVSVRQLFTVILFASIPQMFLRILEGYVPPITLVGMAFTALLLMVGFVENFGLPRKLVIRLIGILYAILFTIWIFNQINSSAMEKHWSHDRLQAPEVELGK